MDAAINVILIEPITPHSAVGLVVQLQLGGGAQLPAAIPAAPAVLQSMGEATPAGQ
jgi:ribosomal protein S12